MPFKINTARDIITLVIGFATSILALILMGQRIIDFVWEGAVGLVVGSILIYNPSRITKLVGDVIKYVFGRGKIPDDTNSKENG